MSKQERVYDIPILESKTSKIDGGYVAILYNESNDFHTLDRMRDELLDSYEVDHIIWINRDMSCRIWTANDTRATIPKSGDPDWIVEREALDFLKVILDKEKDDEYRLELIADYENTINKLREIEPCPDCGGTGDEVVGYSLEERYPYVTYCGECRGTGVTEELISAVSALQKKVIDLKRGKEIE